MSRCLDSVEKSLARPRGVWIVDNGSVDGSLDGLEDRLPALTIIRNGENRGFSAACNQGISAALASGCEAVFLLNNDAHVEPGTLGELLDAALRHKGAGLIAGKILMDDGNRLWCAGVDVGFFANLQRLRGFGEPDRGQCQQEQEVEALTGCGLLVRGEVLEQVGLLDEDYFVYLEDIDLSFRAREAGFSCLYAPEARMFHDASRSTGGGYGAWRKYMLAYNVVVFLRKHGTPGLWAAFLLLEILLWPILLLVGLVRGRGRAVLAKARGTWAALLGIPMRRPEPLKVVS